MNHPRVLSPWPFARENDDDFQLPVQQCAAADTSSALAAAPRAKLEMARTLYMHRSLLAPGIRYGGACRLGPVGLREDDSSRN